MFDFKNKTVLVTGSTRGIGKEIAQAFARAGACVIYHGRQKWSPMLNCKQDEYIGADLAQENSWAEFVSAVQKKTNTLDVLINNAGYESHAPLENFSYQEYRRILNINLDAPIFITQGLFPQLHSAGKAAIINISSIHQTVAVRGNSAYCIAKAGLHMYTKTAALEWAKYGIRVNTIAPGAILTDMNRELVEKIGKEKFAEWIPQGRLGTPEEISAVCLFLASPEASYITASAMFIDGGYSENLLRY